MNPGIRLGLLLIAAGWISACDPAPAPDTIFEELATPPISPRIVTLSPHLAELVFAAGAGDHLIGVSAYSNYPDAVVDLPVVGDAFAVDQERLALLAPDVLLAWESGTPAHTVDELRQLGYRVDVIRTRRLADVAAALRSIGRLSDDEEFANAVAHQYLAELDRLRQAHAGEDPIRVFYQISARPLYTVNSSHYVSELIELCGGRSIFDDLDELAPLVSEEAVLSRNPELLLAGRVDNDVNAFEDWTRWPDMAANRFDNRFYVDADLLARATPRLTRTGAAICTWLDEGRRNRTMSEGR